MDSYDITLLLTPPGIAFVVGLIAQFLIKPGLKIKFGEENKDQYRFVFNSIAILFGIVLGLVASFALKWPPTFADGLAGVLTGFIGGVSAIGSAEFLGNYQRAKTDGS